MSMKDVIYTLISDPGHGWLQVPRDHIHQVGLGAGDFSTYSYLDMDHFYLEEDMDIAIFSKAYANTFGSQPTITLKNLKSKSLIRQKSTNYAGEKDFAVLCSKM